jgi:hypothetical protein
VCDTYASDAYTYAFTALTEQAAAATLPSAMRFGDVVKVNEVEVRQMPEW